MSDAGTGVSGVSTGGVGVYGRGAKSAGYFDGDVKITGNTTTGHIVTNRSGKLNLNSGLPITRPEQEKPIST